MQFEKHSQIKKFCTPVIQMNTDTNCETRRFHPISAFFYTGALFIFAMSWSNPLWLILLLALAAACLLVVADWRAWRNALALSLFMALVICAVNSLFAAAGGSTLPGARAIPLIGRLRICPGALLFGLSAGLKVPLAVGIFILCGELMDQDEVLSFLSRFAPKSSLLATLATLMIPRLRRELERIRTVMSMRGANVDDRRLVARIKASRPLLHVLLLSSLDGAWDTAVSLNCRAFGSGKRSSYGNAPWGARDSLLLGGALIALMLFAIGRVSNTARIHCYPPLDPVGDMSGIPFLILILSIMCLAFCLAWRSKR
jgi:energy-coupling factor transport system permease protein